MHLSTKDMNIPDKVTSINSAGGKVMARNQDFLRA
jgi:hypothetical protein